MKKGDKIYLLQDARYYKIGSIGVIMDVLDDKNQVATVDLAWEDDSKESHMIFIRASNKGKFWDFISTKDY